jgi:Tol biopolymer transport system component
VLTVFAVGTLGDAPYLVTELLEGETLRQRLSRGPVSPLKASGIGAQIARGLAAAHERGILHRDLKPANVFVTNDGRVKILDFGLAKLTRPSDPAVDETRTTPGAILGTVGYMAPEQVRGEATDERTDLFSLGAVLYEMLTGRRAFDEPSAIDTLSAIVHRDVASLDGIAPALSRIVLRCLEKQPAERFQSARDLAFQLDGLASPSDAIQTGAHEGGARTPPRPMAVRALPWAIAAVASVVVIMMSLRDPPFAPRTTPPAAERRFTISTAATPLDVMERSPLAMSGDGTLLAYVGRDRDGVGIYLRSLEQLGAHSVTGTHGGVAPFFSPDGTSLAFFTTSGLLRIALAGGPATRLAATSPVTRGGVWTRDGTIYFAASQHGGIYRVSADGGTPGAVTESDAQRNQEAHLWPDVSRDGSVLIYVARGGDSFDDAHIVARSLRTSEQRVVVEGGTFARFVPGGRIVFARGATLFAAPFDARTLSLAGTPVPVLDGVQMDPGSGASCFAVGGDGTLAYVPGDARPPGRVLLWVTAQGVESQAFPEERPFLQPTVSPDGRTAAVTIEGAHQDVWRLDVGRPVLTRLTSSPGEDFGAIWSSDGSRLAYTSVRLGRGPEVFVKPANTMDGETRLSEVEAAFPNVWLDDATVVSTIEQPIAGRMSSRLLALSAAGAPRPFAPSPYDRYGAAVSHDGTRVAFVSHDTGRAEVYVASLPDASGPVQASVGGGTSPVWSRDASRLFYRSGDAVVAVDVIAGARLATTAPRVLFRGNFDERARPDWPRNYDVAPDGRFLLVRQTYTPAASQVVIALNWRGEAIQAQRQPR